jgi:ribosome biogenesis GTPase / thiamine phosphate phosphatase
MFEHLDLCALRAIGLSQPLLHQLHQVNPLTCEVTPNQQLVRIIEVQRDRCSLHDGQRECVGRVLPALQQQLYGDDDSLVVGDWVWASCNGLGEWWVERRVPPLNRLARRDPQGRRQPLVANVDTAVLVMGLDGDFNLRRLERYLTLARLAGVGTLVLLTKVDTCDAGAERLAAVRALLPPGVEALAVNGLDAATRTALAPWLGCAQTLVLLGSSGAGKSTLTNTLSGQSLQATGGVRADDGRGRHTTTVRSLHRLPGGACVIDTPGLRTLRLDADEPALAAAFDDIVRLAETCRFRDCRHADEPGCAVRAQVAPERLRNYHKLLREARRDSLTLLERRQQLATWKARGRAAQARIKSKRGQ